ncbi:hypothetical protein [Clostridium botulinum]|uniref:hypothetical protein n=1 Tax=Clostridium botulinum TaxID=1491 RepID=UPI0006A5C639|nr:hypothetical protein [Clostridium botulinum]
MKEKVLYECMQCGKTFIERATDGLSCCECKGALRPLDTVKSMKENLSTMQDKLNKASKLTEKKEENTILGYRIYTKEDYKRYLLSNSKACDMKCIINSFEEHWQRMSKGYNFIVGVGKEDRSMMVYSVEHFNDNVLGAEHIKDNRYTIEPQELSKLMKETLTKATEALSLMTKDLMNRSNNNG